MIKRRIALFIIVCMLMAVILPTNNVHAAIQATYYVSPLGSDDNPGTESQPFATIQKARDIVRTVNSNMTGDIYVYLRGGTYTLTDTIDFDQKDSGTNGYNVIYRSYSGETPIISGGTSITEWSFYDSAATQGTAIYKAEVPSTLNTRQLYVNGERAIRARSETSPTGWTSYKSLGYKSTGYTSDNNTVNVAVDMGSSQTISMVKLYPRVDVASSTGGAAGFPVNFTIEVSTNGSSYTTVKTVTNEKNESCLAKVYAFASTSARYVRINATKLGLPASGETSTYRLGLAEIEVYASDNIASGKIALMNNSTSNTGWRILNLTDGDTTTCDPVFGNNSQAAIASAVIDLGSSETVGSVVLYPRDGKNGISVNGGSPDFPIDFTIQLSTDGTNYTTVKTITNQPNPGRIKQKYEFTPASARYIKINATKLGEPSYGDPYNYRMNFSEIEVYSSANLALAKTVTATNSVEDNSFGTVRLTDSVDDYGSASSCVGYILPDSSMASWKNPQDIEVIGQIVRWHLSRGMVSSINGNLLKMSNPMWSYSTLSDNNLLWIENAYELLDKEGEWYLDRSGAVDSSTTPKIYYKLRNGESMSTASVIAPNVEVLVRGKGSLANPIHNIQFAGITFMYTNWIDPSTYGYRDAQGGFKSNGLTISDEQWSKMASAVTFSAANNIRFERNTFTHLGGAALNMDYGSYDNTIIGNVFDDISGQGIYLGDIRDHHPSNPKAAVRDNTISNNYFSRTGQDYYDTVPIWAGYTSNTLIEHNEIYNVPYSGVSIGWGWGRKDMGGSSGYANPTVAFDNHISYNLMNYVMQQLGDGGGIYSLGCQGSPVKYSSYNNNYINYMKAVSMGNIHGFTLYCDEGSQYFDVYNNVVRHTDGKWGITNVAINNIFRDNFTDTADEWINGETNTEYNNTVVTDGNWPVAAQTIMSEAGIESSYQDIIRYSSNNLALNRKINATNSEEILNWGGALLTDGVECGFPGKLGYSSSSYDTSNNTVYVQIDLGSTKSIGSVKLFPTSPDSGLNGQSANFPVDFTIEVSADGTNFTTVRTVAGQENPYGLAQVYAFSQTNARYVRLNVTQLGTPSSDESSAYRLQLAEMEVFEKGNLAWGKTVTVDNSCELYEFGAAKLTDGHKSQVNGSAGLSTFGYGTENNTVNVQIDLGTIQSVGSVKLYPRYPCNGVGGGSASFPVDFTIQVSTDGSNWSTVKTVANQSNPNGIAQEYKFSASNARYVKLVVTKLGTPPEDASSYYYLQLEEMEVFAPQFVPPQSANLKLWLKSDEGITKDSTNKVDTWADQSGNGNNSVQDTTDNKPFWVDSAVNGKPAIYFDGINDYIVSSSMTSNYKPFTIFFVIKPTELLNYNQAFGASGSWGQFWCHASADGAIYIGTSAESRICSSSGVLANNTVQQFTYKLTGGLAATLYKNGTQNSTATLASPSAWTGFKLGTGYYDTLHGYVTEVLIYDTALSDSDRQMVENYLKVKYGY